MPHLIAKSKDSDASIHIVFDPPSDIIKLNDHYLTCSFEYGTRSDAIHIKDYPLGTKQIHLHKSLNGGYTNAYFYNATHERTDYCVKVEPLKMQNCVNIRHSNRI